MSDSPAPETAPKAKAPKSPRLLALVAILNLGGTGFVAFKLVTAKPHAAVAATVHEEPKVSGSEVSGPVVKLDPYVVNLNEPGMPRYLKVSIELEVADSAAEHTFEKSKQVVRDQVLGYLSNLTLAETLGEAAKTKIRTDLMGRLDGVIGAGRVKRMFFSEFVVQ